MSINAVKPREPYQFAREDINRIPKTLSSVAPQFQERCHPSHQYTRGLEDMTNARYSEAVKADVRKRMSPPHRQSVPGFLRNWYSRGDPLQMEEDLALQGEVVPASAKDPRAGVPPTSSRWCWRLPG